MVTAVELSIKAAMQACPHSSEKPSFNSTRTAHMKGDDCNMIKDVSSTHKDDEATDATPILNDAAASVIEATHSSNSKELTSSAGINVDPSLEVVEDSFGQEKQSTSEDTKPASKKRKETSTGPKEAPAITMESKNEVSATTGSKTSAKPPPKKARKAPEEIEADESISQHKSEVEKEIDESDKALLLRVYNWLEHILPVLIILNHAGDCSQM